jgi:HAMP domain-containing protein
MRTISRLYAEYPEEYIAQVREAGTSPAEIAEIERTSSTVLTQSVDTTSVALALKGDRGTVTNAKEYTGKTSITAFRPLDLGKLDWVVIARIDSDEAFGPATDFALRIILTLLVIVLVVCLVSLAFAQYFTRPVRRLADAARAVTNGDVAMRLPNLGSGEVGELGQAFNELSEALAQKQQQVYEQQAENTRMLTAVMPESMARRFHAGEDQIGDDYPDVAVVSTEVLGLEQLAAGRTGPEEIALLRQLAKGFDDAAERMGIERMRSLRGRYMACSGLVTPRVDSVDRAVDFAVEMKAVVERFNTRAETSLTVKIGVSNGLVRAGLIDRRTLAYDLWGEAVDTANAVRWVSPDPGIYLTKAVYDHVRAYHKLVKAGSVETPYGTKDVWRIG